MKKFDINFALKSIDTAIKEWTVPYLSLAHIKCDPFKTLIACILSLRTKDDATYKASEALFAKADTPKTMIKLGAEKIAKLIYPVGFYNRKSVQIVSICKSLIDNFNGIVPDEIDVLLTLDGVGRKTANLVVTEAYNKPGICVDTHVHRITNRWGYINSNTPDETEKKLRLKLPKKYWIDINRLLVTYGQGRCFPISPRCSECEIFSICKRNGVKKWR